LRARLDVRTYTLDVRLAAVGVGAFHLEIDGVNVTGAMTVPNIGAWQTWTTVSKTGIAMTAGPHVLRLVMDATGSSGSVANFNWIAMR